MRLTLRTLLAWLDSLLSPQDQQALADKVAASPVAPTLVRRIQDVVENAALGALRIDARGLADDANSVAEYLDNCLPAGRLEEFERICIESDVHLAEVAACHGVLAEMSRDPAAVDAIDAATRTRLLAAIGDHVAADSPAVIAAATSRGVRPSSAGRKPARRAPVGAWISAGVALVLLVGLASVFVRALVTSGPGRRVAANQPVPVPKPAAPVPKVVAPQAAAPAPPPTGEPRAPEDSVPQAEENAPSNPAAIPVVPPDGVAVVVAPPVQPVEPPPPAARVETTETNSEPTAAVSPTLSAATPAPTVESDRPVQPSVPQGDALAIAALPPVAEPSRQPREERPAAAGAIEPQALVTNNGLLLHRPPVAAAAGAVPVHGASGWALLPPGAGLAAREDLIVPPGSQPEITVGSVTIRLEPATRATMTQDGDGTPRLELVFGRVAIRSAAAGGRLGLTAGGLSGVIVDGLRNPIGVAVVLDREPGAEPGSSRLRAAICTTTAGIRWKQTQLDGGEPDALLEGIAADGLLEAGRRIAWDSRVPDSATVLPGRDLDWIAAPARIDRIDAFAAAALQARLAEGRPFDKTLRDIASDRREREENRALAAATLALVGEYDAVVHLLCAESAASGLRAGRWRSLEQATVPLALARGVNAAQRLERSFEEHAPGGRGRELFSLARGLSDEELAAGGDARLVDDLDAPELSVRRYAHRNLTAIVTAAESARLRYDPEWSAELRRDAVAAWRQQLAMGRIRRPAPAAP
ncbi:MAG: hypothetical protein ACK6CT_12810 [Planctomycetia bacterium]